MGFYHVVRIGESVKRYDTQEERDNPLVLVKKHNALAIKPEEFLVRKWGHPVGWEAIFNDGMFFTNQKAVKNINEPMYAYLFGWDADMLKKAHQISDWLQEQTKSCNDSVKQNVHNFTCDMFDIVSMVGELGRSYGLDEENAYVLLDMSDGMEYSFYTDEKGNVTGICHDLEKDYSKIITKEEILEKILEYSNRPVKTVSEDDFDTFTRKPFNKDPEDEQPF